MRKFRTAFAVFLTVALIFSAVFPAFAAYWTDYKLGAFSGTKTKFATPKSFVSETSVDDYYGAWSSVTFTEPDNADFFGARIVCYPGFYLNESLGDFSQSSSSKLMFYEEFSKEMSEEYSRKYSGEIQTQILMFGTRPFIEVSLTADNMRLTDYYTQTGENTYFITLSTAPGPAGDELVADFRRLMGMSEFGVNIGNSSLGEFRGYDYIAESLRPIYRSDQVYDIPSPGGSSGGMLSETLRPSSDNRDSYTTRTTEYGVFMPTVTAVLIIIIALGIRKAIRESGKSLSGYTALDSEYEKKSAASRRKNSLDNCPEDNCYEGTGYNAFTGYNSTTGTYAANSAKPGTRGAGNYSPSSKTGGFTSGGTGGYQKTGNGRYRYTGTGTPTPPPASGRTISAAHYSSGHGPTASQRHRRSGDAYDVFAEDTQLVSLYRSGIISPEEYNMKKNSRSSKY